ncbi:hypothetical protein MOQ_001254 [Trypanosoma cruzi marinkellei]|uniref:Uncharacterized protein n=1 Tax=Trypanosoma cruzi marinkellei TaxID=85056 RepID=K2PBR6_TRYCR|nr:hypothetical protein MOQ_001254 [Trypanosoma cruzi marinkellei]
MLPLSLSSPFFSLCLFLWKGGKKKKKYKKREHHMSGFRAAGRLEDDGKENRKRTQRSEPACGGSVGWQIASNSRCLACGRLASMCDCQKSRIDPQLKRQKLENIFLSTPYVRSKQVRALEDISREESKNRRRLVERWGDELESMRHLAFTHHRLLLLVIEETAGREALMAMERKAWSEGMVTMDRHIVLCAISFHEREARLQLYASAQREVQVVLAWHDATCHLLGLRSREAALRNALVNHEAAARAALISHNVELLNRMDANEKERFVFYEAFREQREKLVVEWQGGVEVIQSAIAADRRRVEWMLQGRNQLCELCERQRTQLKAEEEECRQRLSEIVRKKYHALMERVRVCEQQRCTLAQQELDGRSAIFQDEAAACKALWLFFKDGEKEARDLEQLRYERRGVELRAAIHQLRSIAEEEAAAFTQLKAQERHEKDLRYQWMFEKEKQRKGLEQVALQQVRLIEEEEGMARQASMKAMQEAEVGIAMWIQQKTRILRELVDTALGQKGEIRLREHEERFALVSRKAEHEDAVRRWIDQREFVRQSLIKEETTHRMNTVEMERAARDEFRWRFDSALEMCRTLIYERMTEQNIFQQKALQVLNDIVEQEAKAMLLMRRLISDDRERTRHEENHRQFLEMWNAEAESRTYIVQKEVRHRESISTQMHLQKSFFAKEAQELLKARICEVLATEESQRLVLLHCFSEATEQIYFSFRQSQEEARRCEKERVLAELRQREMELLEDTRLYREDEWLSFDHTGNRSPGHQESSAIIPSVDDDLWNTQRQLVMAELGGEEADVMTLPPAAVGFLASIVDVISRRESSLTATLRQLEVAVSEARKKVANQNQLLSGVKERWEESKEKMKRDAAEHDTRVAMYRDARQRDEAQLERERARLQTKTEELRRMQDSVSRMRDEIHNQYRKR